MKYNSYSTNESNVVKEAEYMILITLLILNQDIQRTTTTTTTTYANMQ